MTDVLLATETVSPEGRTEGLTITLTPAQARLFLAMADVLLSPAKLRWSATELKLNIAASDNLLRSLKRRIRRASRGQSGE